MGRSTPGQNDLDKDLETFIAWAEKTNRMERGRLAPRDSHSHNRRLLGEDQTEPDRQHSL